MEAKNNYQDYFYYKFTQFNKFGEHTIAYELSTFYREYKRKEIIDTISESIDRCLSGDFKLDIKTLLTLSASGTNKTSQLYSTITTNIEEFSKEVKDSLKK